MSARAIHLYEPRIRNMYEPRPTIYMYPENRYAYTVCVPPSRYFNTVGGHKTQTDTSFLAHFFSQWSHAAYLHRLMVERKVLSRMLKRPLQ